MGREGGCPNSATEGRMRHIFCQLDRPVSRPENLLITQKHGNLRLYDGFLLIKEIAAGVIAGNASGTYITDR